MPEVVQEGLARVPHERLRRYRLLRNHGGEPPDNLVGLEIPVWVLLENALAEPERVVHRRAEWPQYFVHAPPQPREGGHVPEADRSHQGSIRLGVLLADLDAERLLEIAADVLLDVRGELEPPQLLDLFRLGRFLGEREAPLLDLVVRVDPVPAPQIAKEVAVPAEHVPAEQLRERGDGVVAVDVVADVGAQVELLRDAQVNLGVPVDHFPLVALNIFLRPLPVCFERLLRHLVIVVDDHELQVLPSSRLHQLLQPLDALLHGSVGSIDEPEVAAVDHEHSPRLFFHKLCLVGGGELF